MTSSDLMYVPISLEYLLSALFGKLQYHGYVGPVSAKVWRKDVGKIAKYIQRSVEINVSTDAYHYRQIMTVCRDFQRAVGDSPNTTSTNAAAIENLTKLVFLLLGKMPDHWSYRSPYSDRFWELNGHRTIAYGQSDEQKTYQLINYIDILEKASIDTKGRTSLGELLALDFKGNHKEFLAWFKREHPGIYCEVF